MLPPISRHYLLFVFPTGGLEEKIKKFENNERGQKCQLIK
jgi:hypothetical protein